MARGGGPADCVLRADRKLFARMASGKVNAMAAVLRGAVTIEGDPRLLVLFQRLLPGPSVMSDELVKILDGNTFVVSDDRGDIEASLTDPTGLFSFDTRFLSKWVLTIDGERLNALSVDDLQYFETRFFLVPGTGTVYVDAKLSVIRQRAVGDGFHEELTILNHDEKPVELTRADRGRLRLRRPVRGQGRAQEEGHVLEPRRARRAACSATSARPSGARPLISSSRAPAKVDENGLTFELRIAPHGEWTTELDVVARCPAYGGARARRRERRRRTMEANLERWLADAPRLECDWEPLKRRTGAASSTSPRCGSRRRSPAGAACRPPACPGS